MIKTTEGTEKSCNSSLLNLGTNFTAIVEPTHGCNLECKYCYLNKNAESGRMDVKTLKNSIVGVSEFIGKCKTIDFLWHGGEPLLGGIDFFKKVIIIQKEMGEDYTFENTIQTNGTLITEEIADFFRDYKFNVGLSLDGPEEINNRTRIYGHVREGDKGTFRDILHSINLLKEREMKPEVIVTLNKQNIKDVKQIYQFLRDYKIDAKFNPIVRSGRTIENYGQLAISPEEYLEAKLTLFDMWFNDEQPPHLYCLESMLKNILSKNYFNECTFSESCQKGMMSIGPSGNVYPCGEFNGIEEFKYGNINEDDLKNILLHPTREKLLKRAENIEECNNCDYRQLCHGGCMRNAYAFTGDVMDKDPYCPAYKGLFKHLSDKISENECKEV